MRRSAGFSLIEMMVTLAIMSVVMIGIFQVFQEGMQLFRTNSRAADSQRAAVKVMGLISAELVNATPEVAQHHPSGGSEPSGIVFATSLTDTGTARFDDLTGELYWQRYISYYFEPDSSGGFNGKIFRAEETIPAENAGGPGHSDVLGVVAPYIASHPTSYFQTNSAPRKRLVSTDVSGFDITIYDGTEGGNTAGAASVSYEITVEAGDPQALNIRNGYFIKVSSRVSPRG